ncbi:MAG: AbiV family abortive infection protein [Nitrospiraceae bacterium]|nr:AbiV family abortive infection protein [Nitrospiraceae bacterium]
MSYEKTLSSRERKDLLSELARGAKKAFENAEKLFQEASLLRDKGALSRALFLHQISMEECAKVELLGTWATSLLMDVDVDVTELAAKLASHKAKNYTNAYMLATTEEETEARERGDWKGSTEAFDKLQAAFHLESNTAKNASLYVDFNDGRFVAPEERITEVMVSAIGEKNSGFLGLMYPKLKMLLGWEENIPDLEKSFAWFKTRIEDLRSEMPDEPELALSTLMQEMLERALANRKEKGSVGEETVS